MSAGCPPYMKHSSCVPKAVLWGRGCVRFHNASHKSEAETSEGNTQVKPIYLQSEQSTPYNHTRTTRTLKSCNATAAQEGQTDSYNYDTPIRTVAVHLRAAGRCMCRSSITKISAAGDSHHVQQPSIGSACTGGAKNTVGTPKAQSKGLPRMHAYYS